MRKIYSAEFSGLSFFAILILACASFADNPLTCSVIGVLLLGFDFDVSFKDKEA